MTKSNKKKIYRKYIDNCPVNLRFTAIISFVIIIFYAFIALFLNNFKTSTQIFVGSILLILLLICIFLLFKPIFYSFYMITRLENDDKLEGKLNFYVLSTTYLAGRDKIISSIMPVWLILLKTFLIYLVLSLVFRAITFTTLYFVNSDSKSFFDQLMPLLMKKNNVDELNKFLSVNNNLIDIPILYISYFSILISFYYFIHNICVNVFRYFLIVNAGWCNKKVFSSVFNATIKKNRKLFYKNYYQVLFPFTILFFVIFTTSYFAIYFLASNSLSILVLAFTSITISTLFLIPFLSIIYDFYRTIYSVFAYLFLCSMRELLEDQFKILNNADITTELSKEQLEEFYKLKIYVNGILSLTNKDKEEEFKRNLDALENEKKDNENEDKK